MSDTVPPGQILLPTPSPLGEEKRTVADFVINEAGLWCDKVGAMAGVRVPSVVLQHQCPAPSVRCNMLGSW